MRGDTLAIVPAAGIGERVGATDKKQFLSIGSEPIFVRALRRIVESDRIGPIILVAPPDEIDRARSLLPESFRAREILLIEGGATRADSVSNAAEAARSIEARLVLVHDGARPFVSRALIDRTIEAAAEYGGAVPALAPRDSTLIADGVFAARHIDRASLRLIQTPQVFRRALFFEALDFARREKIDHADESYLLDRLGHKLFLVDGNERNFKITTSFDLTVARALMSFESESH